jgi:hypothetical protein
MVCLTAGQQVTLGLVAEIEKDRSGDRTIEGAADVISPAGRQCAKKRENQAVRAVEKLMLTLAKAVTNWRFRIDGTIERRRQRARWHAAMKLQSQAVRKPG